MGENEITPRTDPRKALISAVAMDVGKEVVAYIERMYPQAIRTTSSTFKLSVRNCIHNEIVAMLEVNESGAIMARLKERKEHRRKLKTYYTRDYEPDPEFMGQMLDNLVIDVEGAVGAHSAGKTPLGIAIIMLCEDAIAKDKRHETDQETARTLLRESGDEREP